MYYTYNLLSRFIFHVRTFPQPVLQVLFVLNKVLLFRVGGKFRVLRLNSESHFSVYLSVLKAFGFIPSAGAKYNVEITDRGSVRDMQIPELRVTYSAFADVTVPGLAASSEVGPVVAIPSVLLPTAFHFPYRWQFNGCSSAFPSEEI